MKNYIYILMLAAGSSFHAQIGINTQNPQASFHIDGAKDNPTTGTPSPTQAANDFAITSAGNIGIGNINPASKLVINSGTANTSGFKITNLTSATAVGTGQLLGVDAGGNVIAIANPAPANVQAFEVNSGASNTFSVSDAAWTTVTGTPQTITIPTGGKALFINFILGLRYSSLATGAAAGYYTARLFIDGAQTRVYQTAQESGTPAQFNLSTVIFLSEGNHTIDVRMRRTANISVTPNSPQGTTTLSINFNASYLN